MALNRNDLTTIRQYLLGQLAEHEQQVVEQRLLTEDEIFQELETAEGELVDEYLAGELTPTESDRFEHYFLSTPEHQQDLRFASAFRRYVVKKTVSDAKYKSALLPGTISQPQWLRTAAIVAVLVVMVGAIWFVSSYRQSPQSYATFALSISNNNRAERGQATEIKLPIKADVVRLYLNLPEALDQATRYRVELLKDSGETIRSERVVQAERAAVVELPAGQLSRGEYALRLYVVKSDGTEQRISGSYFLSVK